MLDEMLMGRGMSIIYHGDHVYWVNFANEPVTYRCQVCKKLDLGQRTGGGAHRHLPFVKEPALDMRGAQQVPYIEPPMASWFRPK